MKTDNRYLHIREVEDSKLDISSIDGVFISSATKSKEDFADYCKENAEDFRHSELGNFEYLSVEQREELAKRWEDAAHLEAGLYDYYFNIENKEEIFKQNVKELAKNLGVKYKLTIKE